MDPSQTQEPRPAQADRRVLAVSLAIPVALLILRILLQIASHRHEDFDEYIFLDVGRSIATTGLPIRHYAFPTPAYFFDHTPLYVYMVAAINLVAGDTTITVARAMSAVFGVGTVVLVWDIARRAHGPIAGLIAGSLLAQNLFFARLSWFVRMEVPLCFALILALWALQRHRYAVAGIAIAVAVMLKEIALAFWLVGSLYALLRGGRRAALVTAAPAPAAFAVWMAYAWLLSADAVRGILSRWGNSAGGEVPDPRMYVPELTWARTIVTTILKQAIVAATAGTVVVVAVQRTSWRRVPEIIWVALGYVGVAVATSFVIKLKEPRYLVAIVPMVALIIALAVDWDALAASLLQRVRSRRSLA